MIHSLPLGPEVTGLEKLCHSCLGWISEKSRLDGENPEEDCVFTKDLICGWGCGHSQLPRGRACVEVSSVARRPTDL